MSTTRLTSWSPSFPHFISGLPQAVHNSVASVDADDTSLRYQPLDVKVLNETINKDLRQLDMQLEGKKLSLNVAKANSTFIFTR